MCVKAVAHCVAIPGSVEIDMVDLAAGVNAGVGSPGPLHQGFFTGQRFYRSGQRSLHSRLIGLNLPSCERCAIVLERELVARHAQFTRVPVLICIPRKRSPELMGSLPAR